MQMDLHVCVHYPVLCMFHTAIYLCILYKKYYLRFHFSIVRSRLIPDTVNFYKTSSFCT